MEYLSRRLELLKKDRLFRYHPRCGKLKISHLIFTDDLLLFAKDDLYSIQKLYQCVKDFSDTTGLESNMDKCPIYFGGVDASVKSEIKNFLGFSEGVLPFKYLGVPLIWRLQVAKMIDELCRKFLWGKSENSFKTPLVSWDKVCCGKKQGGLGVFSASNWNLASAMRSIWYIHVNKEILWVKWIHGNYLKHWDVWHVKAKKGDSWMWKQLLKCRDKALNKVGGIDNLKQFLSACYKNSKIQLSAVYTTFSPFSQNVPWINTVWGKLNYPRHSFVMWLAMLNRLFTGKLIHFSFDYQAVYW
ncbi:uncharacterized protein LOC109826779 [Asparagus officinalis]|uniref:uncharacterized protein LOC109826779 n=1 Tax=Asparagus officinalis TaxID=4686 RepID=UPI00098DF656|nr:uncharacterized protein LOC109826779 [Asparagus officinalis]